MEVFCSIDLNMSYFQIGMRELIMVEEIILEILLALIQNLILAHTMVIR